MEKTIKKWWNGASSYYQNVFKIPVDDIYYGPYCPTEKDLNIIDVKKNKNKKVLELGCGGGQCSIFLAKNGFNCSGIDISEKQISYAQQLADKNKVNINYLVGSGESLKMFKDGQFDIVVSIFSLQYIRNLDKCFKEVSRVLKDNGKFIFSLDHPFYSVLSPNDMRIFCNYNHSSINRGIKTSDIINKNKWKNGNKLNFVFYFRKIEDIYKKLTESKLKVEKIIESTSFKKNGPWDKIYSKKLAKYLSPTIIFVARK